MEFWVIFSQSVESGVLENKSYGETEVIFLSEREARDVFNARVDAERKAGAFIRLLPERVASKQNTASGAQIETFDAACCMYFFDDGVHLRLIELARFVQPSSEECIEKINA
jgi:hypothetical protein